MVRSAPDPAEIPRAEEDPDDADDWLDALEIPEPDPDDPPADEPPTTDPATDKPAS